MDVNVDGLIVESEETIVPSLIETDNVTLDDLNQFCRLCGNSGDQMMALFAGEGVEHKLSDKIREHLPMIRVAETDMLPSSVCYSCASTLISWHEIYHTCEDSDRRFRNIVENLKTKSVKFVDTEYIDVDHFHYDSKDLSSSLDRCMGFETNSEDRLNNANETKRNLDANNELLKDCRKSTKEAPQSTATRTSLKSVKSFVNCYKCKRTFDSDAKLRAHFNEQRIICANLKLFHSYYDQMKSQPLLPPERINPELEFACGQCQQRFATKMEIKTHIICFHPCIKKFSCDYCSAKFVTECDLAEHRIGHSSRRNVVCSKCGGRNGQTGLSYEKNQQQIMFELCVCKKVVKNAELSVKTNASNRNRNRKKKTTFEKGNDKKKPIVDDADIKPIEIDRNSVCPECGKQCKSPYMLKRHKKVHRGKEECNVCGKSYPKLYINSHKLIHGLEKTFVCDTCGKGFAQYSSLRSHQLLEKNITKYVCTVCGMQFILNSRLHTHMKSHAESLPFKCEDCDRQYGYIWQLRQHRIKHSDERAFVCEVCARSFKTKKHLKQHFVIHWRGR